MVSAWAADAVRLRRVSHCVLCVGGVLYNLQRVERRPGAVALQSRL